MKYGVAFAAGLVASFAMDVAQGGFAQVFERGRAPGDEDEELEAIASVVRVVEVVVPGLVPNGRSETAGHVLHYLFGSAFALAYAALREREPRIATGAGTLFGTALWILSDRILIPGTKLGRPWSRYSTAERANALVSHLAYAACLEGIVARAA